MSFFSTERKIFQENRNLNYIRRNELKSEISAYNKNAFEGIKHINQKGEGK